MRSVNTRIGLRYDDPKALGGWDIRVFRILYKVVGNVGIKEIYSSNQKVPPVDSIWWSLDQESNVYLSELTWHVLN